MAETNIPTPEAIDVERVKFEPHARDRADRTLRALVLILLVDVALVVATFVVAHLQSIALDRWVVAMLLASIPVSAIFLGAMWLPAQLQRKHYDSRALSTWTLSCDDVEHEWRIEGIGPATGWRDVSIKCKKLPSRTIRSPRLYVRIDNEQGVLKSGHMEEGGENTSLFVIDKQGLPIGITLGHIKPKHASPDEPWVVELTVFGDANTLETILAWPVPKQVGTDRVEGDGTDSNRQA